MTLRALTQSQQDAKAKHDQAKAKVHKGGDKKPASAAGKNKKANATTVALPEATAADSEDEEAEQETTRFDPTEDYKQMQRDLNRAQRCLIEVSSDLGLRHSLLSTTTSPVSRPRWLPAGRLPLNRQSRK